MKDIESILNKIVHMYLVGLTCSQTKHYELSRNVIEIKKRADPFISEN